MATKLHLATFLQEIRCYQAIADRRPEAASLRGVGFPGLTWPADLPVGIRRRRLVVEMQHEPNEASGWPVPIRRIAGVERIPDPAGPVATRRTRPR
ncbi:hypothetical protein [Limisphaera sp. VF-2]|uniref:hypothetical protein n=1 Tax=Limisphaera sp. VF-2 TaxID=3400418 RepID=UPI003C1AE476